METKKDLQDRIHYIQICHSIAKLKANEARALLKHAEAEEDKYFYELKAVLKAISDLKED